MQANIYSHEQLIGHADLIPGDISMGHIYGTFLPNDAYYQQIQRSIWEFIETHNYPNWFALSFSVQLESGVFLHPAGGYEIIDSPEFPDEPKEMHLAGVDYQIIEDYIISQPPRQFLEEPWYALNIQQKIAHEAKLKASNLLPQSQFSAMAYCEFSQAILFSVDSKEGQAPYVVVEPTQVTFYESLDEFKLKKAYPDKIEWEH